MNVLGTFLSPTYLKIESTITSILIKGSSLLKMNVHFSKMFWNNHSRVGNAITTFKDMPSIRYYTIRKALLPQMNQIYYFRIFTKTICYYNS
jgi:hypothetical protein